LKKIIFYPLFLFIILLMMALGYLNQTQVTVNLLVAKVNANMAVVMALSILSGFLFGLLMTLYINKKHQLVTGMQQRKADKEAKKREAELPKPVQANAQTLPATTSTEG
jgi:uncharacterized membrane protein YciS (DUF1049 family)